MQVGVCTDIRNMWDFHLQNHQHFDTFVKDFKEKHLKIKLKYEHKISHVSYVRAHPNVMTRARWFQSAELPWGVHGRPKHVRFIHASILIS